VGCRGTVAFQLQPAQVGADEVKFQHRYIAADPVVGLVGLAQGLGRSGRCLKSLSEI
jgi:hypothetical protein